LRLTPLEIEIAIKRQYGSKLPTMVGAVIYVRVSTKEQTENLSQPTQLRACEEYATGRFTKQQVLEQARAWGLTNRRNRPLTSQAIGVLLSNQLYAGIVDVPEYGVRGKRGDFEPLISEDLFYRLQAVSGGLPSTTPKQGAHPDFRLRGFVRCGSCGRGLTAAGEKAKRLRVCPLLFLLRSGPIPPSHDYLKCRFANARPEPDF
jgi:hypothetical protein